MYLTPLSEEPREYPHIPYISKNYTVSQKRNPDIIDCRPTCNFAKIVKFR